MTHVPSTSITIYSQYSNYTTYMYMYLCITTGNNVFTLLLHCTLFILNSALHLWALLTCSLIPRLPTIWCLITDQKLDGGNSENETISHACKIM